MRQCRVIDGGQRVIVAWPCSALRDIDLFLPQFDSTADGFPQNTVCVYMCVWCLYFRASFMSSSECTGSNPRSAHLEHASMSSSFQRSITLHAPCSSAFTRQKLRQNPPWLKQSRVPTQQCSTRLSVDMRAGCDTPVLDVPVLYEHLQELPGPTDAVRTHGQ